MNALVDLFGLAAHLKQLAASFAVRITPLRILSILANLLFVAYALLIAHWPTLLLNALQLPVNIKRLVEARALVRRIGSAQRPEAAFAALRRGAPEERFAPGDVVFRRGDAADRALLVESGEIALPELGQTVGAGEILGEVGLLLPERARTATAVARTEVVARAVRHEAFEALCRADPALGFALMRLVVRRLKATEAALLAKGGAAA